MGAEICQCVSEALIMIKQSTLQGLRALKGKHSWNQKGPRDMAWMALKVRSEQKRTLTFIKERKRAYRYRGDSTLFVHRNYEKSQLRTIALQCLHENL